MSDQHDNDHDDDDDHDAQPWNDPRLDPRQRSLLRILTLEQPKRLFTIDQITKDRSEIVRRANANAAAVDAREALGLANPFTSIVPLETCVRRDGTFTASPGGNIVK
jgi:hypothetical protein